MSFCELRYNMKTMAQCKPGGHLVRKVAQLSPGKRLRSGAEYKKNLRAASMPDEDNVEVVELSDGEEERQRQHPPPRQNFGQDQDAKKREIKTRLELLASLKHDGDIDDVEHDEQRRRILNDI